MVIETSWALMLLFALCLSAGFVVLWIRDNYRARDIEMLRDMVRVLSASNEALRREVDALKRENSRLRSILAAYGIEWEGGEVQPNFPGGGVGHV